MDNTILDLPLESSTVFNNKTGGAHTTPFLYIAICIMFLGTVLVPIPLAGIIVSLPFFFSSSWAKVNVSSRKICRYWKVIGITLSSDNWQPLPPIKAVTVIRVKLTQTLASRGSQTTLSDFIYKVQLAGEEKKIFLLFTTDNREKALYKANEIAAFLEVNIVDYTDPNRKITRRRR